MIKKLAQSAGMFFLCCCVCLSGCGQEVQQTSFAGETSDENVLSEKDNEEPVEKELFAMDTYMVLKAYGENAREALNAAAEEITAIEEMVSTGKDTSEISMLNKNGSGKVSKATGYMIVRSIELYKETGGVFDISIYPVMRAWGFTDQNYRIPDEKELSGLLETVHADRIRYDEENCQVSFDDKGMEIDLGGIAKGYTADRVIQILKDYEVESAVISLGGNVKTLNKKPDGKDWRIAVEDPGDSGKFAGILTVSDKAVVTSGGYERYFEQDGEKYHHIIDPSTGYPAKNGLSSVSIISEDGALADGLSTSLFIMGKEKAAEYWKNHSDEFDAVLVEDDGTVWVTEGIADCFTSDENWKIIGK